MAAPNDTYTPAGTHRSTDNFFIQNIRSLFIPSALKFLLGQAFVPVRWKSLAESGVCQLQ